MKEETDLSAHDTRLKEEGRVIDSWRIDVGGKAGATAVRYGR